MEIDGSVWTVLVTIVTVLGSASAWRFYEKRALKKERDEDFLRLDFKDRVLKLEALLDESSREKDDMRNTILRLTEQVAQLSIKVEYLQKENSKLLDMLNRYQSPPTGYNPH
jgi:peptidoglycan hydrolase CwlO-like protein